MEKPEEHHDTALHALVVYESMFGNTESVAHAVAAGLADAMATTVCEVRTAPATVDDVDLLVVGAPTHALGLSRAATRRSAGSQGARAPAADGIGVREWLADLPRPSTAAARAAAFDTRVARPRLPGSAARAARRRLRALGFETRAKARTFWVKGTPGPLAPGEVHRAQSWGRQLAEDAAASSATTRRDAAVQPTRDGQR